MVQTIRKGRSPIVKGSKPMTADLRALRQPVWDSDIVLAAGSARLEFYSNRRQFITGAVKGEADTNMTDDGSLGDPAEMDVFGITFYIRPTNVAGTIADNWLIYSGFCDFIMNRTTNLGKSRLDRIPTGVAPTGFSNIAGTVLFANGMPSENEFWNICDQNRDSRHLGRGETFRMIAQWVPAILPSVNTTVMFFLKGLLYSPM